MVKKAVILCGGLATRMLPATKSVPKEMLTILNRPAIDYCIKDLKENGITEILIIIGRNKDCLEYYFDRNLELEEKLSKKSKELQDDIKSMYEGLNIYFSRQKFAKGTGFAVYEAKNFVGDEPFVLMYPDEILIGQSFTKLLLEKYEETKASILPTRKIPLSEANKYGMLSLSKNQKGTKIEGIVEKPNPEDSPSDVCYMGGGLFNPDIFDYLKDCKTQDNGEIYLTDAFAKLIEKDSLYGIEMDGDRLDIGNPLGFVKANVLAGLRNEKTKDELMNFLKEITNKPQISQVKIAKDAIIHQNVTFVGDCEIGSKTEIFPNSVITNSKIGENCIIKSSYIENSVVKNNITVGPFAHIRPGSCIEDDCKIGNFVEIKNSHIGKNTAASHLAYVGDADVGENCNIGCGAIFVNYNGQTKNRIVVGNNCFVGSNCNLIAPLKMADNTYLCAGTTLTKDTQEFDFVIGRERETIKPKRARKYIEDDK